MDTRTTDTRQRIISSVDLPASAVLAPRGWITPETASATYNGRPEAGNPDRWEWVVHCHLTGRVLSNKTGRPTSVIASVDYMALPGDGPESWGDWPTWVVEWLERNHPARGGPENDPEGSYLG